MIPQLPKGYSHPMAIGEGAFSSVYRARQTSLDRWVALKLLKETDPEKRAEQLKEARLQAKLGLRHTPEVFDVSEWKSQILIVMQWVHGIPLNQLKLSQISDSGKMGLAEEIIVAVAELHRGGHTHGDLKPDNILLSPTDGVYLIDFGFARAPIQGQISGTTMVRGTPAYMAPELKFGKGKIDHYKAEVYSVGKIIEPLLKETSAEKWIQSIIAEDADQRPENAEKVLELWLQHFPGLDTPQWKVLTEEKAAMALSDNLFRSAHQLIQSNRLDEAYWLISECLESNPSHSEALTLLQTFPILQQKARRKATSKIILSSSAALLILLGFFAGLYLASDKPALIPKSKGKKSLLTPSRHLVKKSRQKRAYLKPAYSAEKGLNSYIHIPKIPLIGTLVINGDSVRPEVFGTDYPISHGKHTIKWKRYSDSAEWSCAIDLLPFQTKSFTIPNVYLQ